jgi:hypothetical protein
MDPHYFELLDPDPGGQKWPTKIEKVQNFHVSSTGCSLLRAEGFSCSLGVLYGGLGISKLQFLIKKIEIKFPFKFFFSILGHQTLDPDPQLEKMLDPDPQSALNQCGSETLPVVLYIH